MTAQKKVIERRFLETAQAVYGEFPQGNIEEGETPDFVVTTETKRIGIEVRRLVQSMPSAVESFRHRVVQLAEELYRAEAAVPLDVTVCLSSRPNSRQDKQQLAKTLAEFARENYSGEPAVQHFRKGKSAVPLPNGIDVVTLAVPLRGMGHWFGTAVNATPLLGKHLLAEAIAEKDRLVAAYRKRVDEIWLLLVAEDLNRLSGNVNVPRSEINAWRFLSRFDRVLLLSCWYREVWVLSHREESA